MTIIKQIIAILILNLCLYFAAQYYAALKQQQRQYYYAQLAHLHLAQGIAIAGEHSLPLVYNRWQAQIKNKLPEGSGTINNKTITIKYKSSLQDEIISLSAAL
jgi:hypothetical protein